MFNQNKCPLGVTHFLSAEIYNVQMFADIMTVTTNKLYSHNYKTNFILRVQWESSRE